MKTRLFPRTSRPKLAAASSTVGVRRAAPMRKPIAGLPALHEPWRLGGFIEVEGATPEMWGASWWETCRHCLQQRPEAAALLDESK